MSSERRSSPRVQILGRLYGHVVALDVPVAVTEMSLGGMRIEVGIPFEAGTTHAFLLTLGDGSTARLTGIVVHCRAVAKTAYALGIQFTGDEPAIVADVLKSVR